MASMVSSAPHIRKFRAMIDCIPTEVMYFEHSNCDNVIVIQTGGIKTAGRVNPARRDGESRYTFITVFRSGIFIEVAEVIAINLNITRPLVLFLMLRNYEAGTVMDLLDISEYVLGKYFINSHKDNLGPFFFQIVYVSYNCKIER